MGWKEGSGLGLAGEGRVDPVMAQAFSNRAGLGASKVKEAERSDGGHGSYKDKARESVRCGFLSVAIRVVHWSGGLD
jgi:RNA-binding protein 5/10